MALVGLISDTHNHLPLEALHALEGCDRIIHAGDICEPRILWELEVAAPVTAVLGNNDHMDFGPAVVPVANVVIEGVRFVVVHNPAHLPGALAASRDAHPDFSGHVVGVYGHKHVPYLQAGWEGGLCDLKVSPGSVFRSREEMGRRCIGKVEVSGGRVLRAWVEDLLGNEVVSLAF